MSDQHSDQPIYAAGPPLEEARAAMVLVHGRGASAHSILTLADELGVADVTFLAPQAAGHTWYPLSFLAPWEPNEPGITSGLEAIGRAINRIRDAGLPTERTLLLGFSQGACLTAEFAARHPARYGGVFILTGGLIGETITPQQYTGSLDGCPILLATGDPDPHVPFTRVEETAAVFRTMNARVELVRYPGRPHSVSEDELRRIREHVDRMS